jgi:hypothetical protein
MLLKSKPPHNYDFNKMKTQDKEVKVHPKMIVLSTMWDIHMETIRGFQGTKPSMVKTGMFKIPCS